MGSLISPPLSSKLNNGGGGEMREGFKGGFDVMGRIECVVDVGLDEKI